MQLSFLLIGDEDDETALEAEIRAQYPDGEVVIETINGIVPGISQAHRAIANGTPYDHIFIDPNLGGTIAKLGDLFKGLEKAGIEFSFLQPNIPLMKQAIAKTHAPVIPSQDKSRAEFMEQLILELVAKKSTGGKDTGSYQRGIEQERIKGQVAVVREQINDNRDRIKVLEMQVSAIRDQGIQTNLQITALANEVKAYHDVQKNAIAQLQSSNAELLKRVAELEDDDPDDAIEIAKINSRKDVRLALLTIAGTALTAIVTWFLAPKPDTKHPDPAPKVSPSDSRK